MVNFIGGHFSRNGVEKNWPARGVISYAGNGLSEQNEGTVVVWRDGWCPERPPDLYTNPLGNTMEFAQYYYDNPDNVVQEPFKKLWTEAKANHPEIDYFVFTNEACGTNRHEVETYIAYERHMCELAHADGFKLGIGKFANGTPQWDSELWQELYAPWIIEAWEKYGAIYTRHVYGLQGDGTPGDLVDADGNIAKTYPGYPYRVIDELQILQQFGWGGGLLICECGLDGGYGHADWDRFYFQITKFEQALRPYADNVIGFAWWECGNTNWEADYTQDLKECTPYMAENSMPKWEGTGNTTPPTEPPVTEPPESIDFPNGCFSDGWQTLLGGNQQPNEWLLSWNQEGSLLPNGEYATRSPECVHKEDWQLPPNEQPGGDDALILCGDKTYKMFGDYGKWGAMLSCVIDGLTPGAWYYIGGNFQVHYEEVCNEIDDILVDFSAGDDKIQLNTDDLRDRKWIYSEAMCQADADGKILVDVHAYTKYMNRRTLFVDKFTIEPVEEVEPPVEPPITGTTEEKIFQISQSWAFPVNEDAALQKAGLDDGYTPSGVERWLEVDGSLWAMQPFFKMDETDKKRSYFCLVNAWDNVEWTDGTTQPEVEIQVVPLWQRDERWKNQLCGYGPKTIGNWGCLLTAYTMWARHFGINSNRLVGDENTYYVNMGGFSGNNLVSMAMSRVYNNVKDEGWLTRDFAGMETKTKEWLDKGIPVPARVDFKPDTPQWEQHWVLLVGYTDDDWLMNDPWTGEKAVKVSDYYGIAGNDVLECLYYYLDDEPTEPEPPTGETVNLASYQVGIPTAFRVVKHVDNNGHETNEEVQDMWIDDSTVVMRKNINGEWYRLKDEYRLRLLDTSPAPGFEGIERVYRMTQDNSIGGRVNPANIELGKRWTDSTAHYVQFYAKDGCRELSENSGAVTSSCVATLEKNVTFNTYGQNLTFDEVVYVETNNDEKQMYGVYQGQKVGWIGWVAPWGTSEPVEIRFDRGVMTQEPNRYCSW